MKRNNIIKILYIFLLIASATGCTDNESDSRLSGKKGEISVEMTVPAFEKPVTRSIDGDKGEAVVKQLDLLLFDNSSPAKLIGNISLHENDFSQSLSGSEYKITFNLSKDYGNDDAASIAIIANASDVVQSALTANPGNPEKQLILEALKFSTVANPDGTYKWNVSGDNYTPIPMYGEADLPNGFTPGEKINMPLVRMLARIDVENQIPDAFILKEISLVNYNTTGYIAPAWDENGVIYQKGSSGYLYQNSNNPMVPNPSGNQNTGMTYTYTEEGEDTGKPIVGEIYTYEAPKTVTSGNNPVDGPCLILKGDYKGTDYYYRVDFTLKKETPSAPNEVEYMPLYRNHKYIVTITAAQGIGYATFEEAVASKTVLSNLKTSILVIDMAGIREIVYNGQHFMGVDSRTKDIPWNVSGQFVYNVSSDYEGAWSARILDQGQVQTQWLTLTDSQGEDINKGLPLRIEEIATGDKNAYITGVIELTAGRLRDTLAIRRVPMADMFARSNIVKQGNRLTFAVTAEDNNTIPAYSQGVFFKWGSLIALAPIPVELSPNPYDPSEYVIYNPTNQPSSQWANTDSLAAWDNIPYIKENSNMPQEDETTGVGDICRYISSKAGWIEGKWRMPNNEEMELLFSESDGNQVITGDFKNKTISALPAGMADPESGWFVGANVNSGVNNTKTPPEGTLYLPASGHRYPNGGGRTVHIGAYGYYWTTTSDDGITAYYPFISNFGSDYYQTGWINDADHSYAFPIRCIKDY